VNGFWQKKEKRRFRRVSLSADLFYRVMRVSGESAGASEKEDTVPLINISEGGLSFMADVQIPCDTAFEVTFHFLVDGRRDIKIKAEARARYCLLMGDYKRYQVGTEFTRIDDADRKFIADYVRTIAPTPQDKMR
jgi:hypothetical protein